MFIKQYTVHFNDKLLQFVWGSVSVYVVVSDKIK